MLKRPPTSSLEPLSDGDSCRRLYTPASPDELKSGRGSYGTLEELEEIDTAAIGNVNLLFSPREYYLFSTRLPKMKQELQELQIRKRFNDAALTMESDAFIHRCRRNPKIPDQQDCIFVPRTMVYELLHRLAGWPRLTAARLLPVPVAIAALLQRLTSKGVMVLLVEKSYAQVIVVHDGIPLYNQMLAQVEPGVVEESLVPNAIDFARTAARNDHGLEELQIITMGEARDSLDLSVMGVTEWKPTLTGLGKTSVELEQLLRFPQLYGAPLAEKEWSFVEPEYTLSWKLQTLSRKLTAAAALVMVAAALAGGWFFLQLQSEKERWHQARHTLESRQSQIDKLQSDTDSLDNFAAVAAIRSNFAREFRLDTLLQLLATALPKGVVVSGLEVTRAAADEEEAEMPMEQEAADTSAASPAAGLLKRPAEIRLTCRASGEYPDVTRRLEQALTTLGSLFTVKDGQWHYTEKRRSGLLTCTLRPIVKQAEEARNE